MSGGNANVYFKLSDKSNDALGYIIFFGFYLFNLHPVKNPFILGLTAFISTSIASLTISDSYFKKLFQIRHVF